MFTILIALSALRIYIFVFIRHAYSVSFCTPNPETFTSPTMWNRDLLALLVVSVSEGQAGKFVV